MTELPRSEPLLLRELLGDSFDATQYKLHCARRDPQGEDPLDAYAAGWNNWVSLSLKHIAAHPVRFANGCASRCCS